MSGLRRSKRAIRAPNGRLRGEMRMRCQRGNFLWLAVILLACVTSALGNTYRVRIGNDCRPGFGFVAPVPAPGAHYAPACFSPAVLAINIGDSVQFYNYADIAFTGLHNVVADDGSFRCARGCDGEGGNGTPAGYGTQWRFTRTFTAPGTVKYHDEFSRASGVIVVQAAPDFAIGPGITGAWYDPNQTGHGLFIEVLS